MVVVFVVVITIIIMQHLMCHLSVIRMTNLTKLVDYFCFVAVFCEDTWLLLSFASCFSQHE